MRDSGQTWLGLIPSSWRLSKIASLYSQRNEKVSDKDYPPLSVTMKGVVPQLETAAKSEDGDNRKLVRIGDFAINSRSDRRGSCGISMNDGSVSLINTVLTPRGQMYPKYYDWLFHTAAFADEYYKWGHGIVDDLWTTHWQEMKRIIVPVPPLEEQKAIATYLDDQVSRIDSIIEESKRSIEEYKQWRASLIADVVTHGIKSKSSLKESGVKWIGVIPAAWGCKRLKYFGKQSTEHAENNQNYIGLENIESGSGKYIESSSTDFQAEGTSLKIRKGDVIFGKLRPYLAKSYVAQEDGCGSTEFIVIRPYNCDARYLMYIMLSPKFIDIVNMSTYGAKMPRANWNYIGNIKAPFPTREEQKEISSYLDYYCSVINSVISEKEKLLQDIDAYKRSLIFETVTGKRKVV